MQVAGSTVRATAEGHGARLRLPSCQSQRSHRRCTARCARRRQSAECTRRNCRVAVPAIVLKPYGHVLLLPQRLRPR